MDPHVLERHRELVGQQLREGGLVALSVRRRAGRGADPAVALHGDLRVLPAPHRQRRRGAHAADLDVHRQAQPDQPAVGARGVPFGPELLPAGLLQRAVEGLAVVARVVHRPGLRGVGKLLRPDEVLPAQLGRIHSQLAGEHVDGPLQEVDPFRPARATIGVRRGLVGEHLRERRADRRDGVVAARHHHRGGRNGGGEQMVVGSDVGDDAELDAEHRPVASGRQVDVADEVAAVGRREKRLRALLHPLDRHAQPSGDRGRHELLRGAARLAAEAAADLRRDGAHLVLAHIVHRGDERAQQVRGLGGRPDGDRVLARLVVGHGAARLERRRREPLVDHALRDHHLGVREGLVDGRVVDLAVRPDAGAHRQRREHQVVRKVGVQQGRLAGHRRFGIDHDRQRLVVDRDGVGRVPREVAVAGHHDRYRLADEADDPDRHRAALRSRERQQGRQRTDHPRHLRTGEHLLDAVERFRRARIDGQDAPVRDVAALEREVQHSGELDVVDVGPAALDQARVLAPLDALADELRQDGRYAHGT